MKLTRDDWEEAAFRALLDGGSRAIAVAPLADRLGVTRGSFYHYFASREELLAAALARWEQQATDALIATSRREEGPKERLERLFAQVFRIPTALGRAERRLLADGDTDPLVAEVVARVTARRKAYLAGCYRELGYPGPLADDLALVAYMTFIGWLHLDETSGGDGGHDIDRLASVVRSRLLSTEPLEHLPAPRPGSDPA